MISQTNINSTGNIQNNGIGAQHTHRQAYPIKKKLFLSLKDDRKPRLRFQRGHVTCERLVLKPE